jgi:hypothetical protein
MQNLFIRWLFKGWVFAFFIVASSTILLVFLPANPSSYLSAILDKHELLKLTPGHRVIMVGGSNIAFSLDSERLISLLDKPVINDGLHAGLGMRFILNDLVPFLHSGDAVVLSPEYSTFFNDALEGNDLTMALLLEVYPQAVQSFEAPQYVRLLDFYITMLRARVLRLANILIYTSEIKDPIYNRAAFNRYGDVIAHIGKQSVLKIENSAYISASTSYNMTVIDVFNRFARQASVKDAKVFLVFPASRKTNCIATKSRFEQLENYLRKHLDFPVLSHPLDSCLDDVFFFDSRYHLNKEGRQLRTLQLAELLINNGLGNVGQ